MIVIAVTQRTELVETYQEVRDALDQRWHDLFAACDIMPCLMPNHLSIVKNMVRQFPIQGVLLTGGNHDNTRFNVETFLIQYAIENQLPILGVCHGMQAIQEYFHIPLHDVAGHVLKEQEIFMHDKSRQVNSYHQQGTTQTIDEIIVWAKAHDGVIKAICHQFFPIVGIMWHPERYHSFHQEDIQLIKQLFNQSKELLQQLRRHSEEKICEPSF
jgi:N5-(cytidine 5'-diphosphoramidyl)-L-glutamine hydrolase